jgi:hypothetical protein
MKRFVVITGAALMIAASGIVGCKKDEATPQAANATPGQKTEQAITDAGKTVGKGVGKAEDATVDAAQAAAHKVEAAAQPSADAAIKGTRAALTGAIDDAVTHNDLNKLIGYFDEANRTRIGKVDKATFADLNAAIDQFRTDWKAKYGQDFKISDKEELVFGGPVQIQIADPTNNLTTVTFPPSGDAPAVTLQLANVGTVTKDYRINVPNTLDGNVLRDRLATKIKAIDGMNGQWPADVNEASRMVAQHILAVIEGGQ